MQPSLDPIDLPLSVRIMPSRSFLRAALVAGLVLMLLFGWLAGTLGRGLMLIRLFMDEIAHEAEGRRIRMVKRSARPGLGVSWT